MSRLSRTINYLDMRIVVEFPVECENDVEMVTEQFWRDGDACCASGSLIRVFRESIDDRDGIPWPKLTSRKITSMAAGCCDIYKTDEGLDLIFNHLDRKVLRRIIVAVIANGLHRFGCECLHSSAVLLDSSSFIAIAGHSGTGKSSVAQAFKTMGFAVLTDNFTILDDSGTWRPLYNDSGRSSATGTGRCRPRIAGLFVLLPGDSELKISPWPADRIAEISTCAHFWNVFELESYGTRETRPLTGQEEMRELLRHRLYSVSYTKSRHEPADIAHLILGH